jgi:hypothetical protein
MVRSSFYPFLTENHAVWCNTHHSSSDYGIPCWFGAATATWLGFGETSTWCTQPNRRGSKSARCSYRDLWENHCPHEYAILLYIPVVVSQDIQKTQQLSVIVVNNDHRKWSLPTASEGNLPVLSNLFSNPHNVVANIWTGMGEMSSDTKLDHILMVV